MSIKHVSDEKVTSCECSKGTHGPFCDWCGDEWPCEYAVLVRSKNFIAGLKLDAESEVRRLEDILTDLELFLDRAVASGYDEITVNAVRGIMEDEDELPNTLRDE